MLDELNAELQFTIEWIDENFRNCVLTAEDDRTLIAVGCYDIAIEHQAAMLLLCRARLFALMFAAQRLLFESLLRGLWFQYCATDKEVEEFKHGESLLRGLWFQYCATDKEVEEFKHGTGPKKFAKMIAAIESKIGAELLPLQSYRERLEGHLHDFIHTGFQHITRRHRPGEVGANYPDREICQAVNLAALLGLQAAARMAVTALNEPLANATHEKMVAYAKRFMQLRDQS